MPTQPLSSYQSNNENKDENIQIDIDSNLNFLCLEIENKINV